MSINKLSPGSIIQCRTTAFAIALLAATVPLQADTPSLVYETTVTGFNEGAGWDMVIDDTGNAYVLSQDRDDDGVNLGMAVAKIGPAGEPLWVTHLSGSDHDNAGGIALNSLGEVCITGFTDSADWPTVNALQPYQANFREAFVTKLSTEDGSITYSTYLGGDYTDTGYDIAIASNDDIIIVGTTASTDFPTVNPIQAELNSPPYWYTDLFITRLSPDGSEILYSTYLGSSHDERIAALALDDQDRIYVATNAEYHDFPTVNPLQNFAGGLEDVVVARLAADGSAVDFATYLGGTGWEHTWALDVDAAGKIYVAGTTESEDYPTTPGAYQPTFVGEINGCGSPPFDPLHNCSDAFITKINPDLGTLEYSTFLAGHNVDAVRDVMVDNAGRAHVAGYTYSNDFPGAAFGEFFAVRLTADGSDVEFTLSHDSFTPNGGETVAVDDSGDVYFAGSVELPSQLYVARYDAAPGLRPGDGNCDGAVSWRDIDYFVAAMNNNVAQWEAMFDPAAPRCGFMNNDVNGDGMVNWRDVDPFVALLAP